ncbi:MAG: CinA family protein [Bacteroidales bacterium]|jgi:nicotinamide-nucleotide amidase|nr:CinA family protein [Bacteroidales bacterium]
MTTNELFALNEIIGAQLRAKNASLATAESCTGGAVAQSITAISGCSAYFKGSVVAYSNEVKQNLLHVPEFIITSHGAVSKECVQAMAQNCRRIFNTTYAIATSGIAGPGGGTDEKPVGTVWIAVAAPQGIVSHKCAFSGTRAHIVEQTLLVSLQMLLHEVEQQ